MNEPELSLIECLPLELVDAIAQQLSVKDLAVCCACSHALRDKFGHDVVWKCRCNLELAEHLRDTPCRVTPGFINPETEDSTLSDISAWRLAYMRENHLMNNWRLGRYKTVNVDSSFKTTLLSDYYVLQVYRRKVKIIDPGQSDSNNRAHVLDSISLSTKLGEYYIISTYKDMIVIIYQFAVQVYHHNAQSHEWYPKHTLTLSDAPDGPAKAMFPFTFHAVANNMFIGFSVDDLSMHIWDINTGQKLKVESCPVDCSMIRRVITSKNMNIALVLQLKSSDKPFSVVIYSLNTFAYLPFKLPLNYCPDSSSSVSGDYVCICKSYKMAQYYYEIYNYQTAKKVHFERGQCSLTGDGFLFVRDNEFKMFNTKTHQLLSLKMSGIRSIFVLCNRFLKVRKESNEEEILEFDCVRQTLKNTRLPAVHFTAQRVLSVNMFYTMCILDDSVLFFW